MVVRIKYLTLHLSVPSSGLSLLARGLAIPAFQKASLIETFGNVILTWATSTVTPILNGNLKAMGLIQGLQL
jgi:hypothetical protein